METVKRSGRILVAFRKEWTVDALAASLALARILSRQGKRIDVAADGFGPPGSLRFLPGAEGVKPALDRLQQFVISLDVSKTKIDELAYDLAGDKLLVYVTPKTGRFESKDVAAQGADFKYDLIITVDTPDYASLGGLFSSNSDFFYARPTVNIDHEPSNERYGNINLVDITAASAAEVVHSLFAASGEHFLDEDTATCLLAGMISKTRSFKTATVTPKTLAVASELVAAGARREEIVRNLYRTRSISTLKLWGRALARLKHDPITRTAWTLLVRQDFIHAGAEEEDLPEVIDELIANSPEAEIVALLYEQGPGGLRSGGASAGGADGGGKTAGVCALVSSEKHADALGLVAGLKAEGSRKLARVCFPGASLLEAERAVLGAVAKSLGKVQKAPELRVAPAAAAETSEGVKE